MTLHHLTDDELDDLVGQVRSEIDLAPGALARLRPVDEDLRPTCAVVKTADRSAAGRRRSWLPAVAAGVATLAVLAGVVGLRPTTQDRVSVATVGSPSQPATPSPTADPGIAVYPDVVTPRLWEEAGPEQRSELADGVLVESEYVVGFERYRACLRAGGVDLDSVVRPGPLFFFSLPAEAVDTGVDGPCYDRHWRLLDMVWQSMHPEASPANLRYRFCLEQAGIDPGGTAVETQRIFASSGLTDDACTQQWLDAGSSSPLLDSDE